MTMMMMKILHLPAMKRVSFRQILADFSTAISLTRRSSLMMVLLQNSSSKLMTPLRARLSLNLMVAADMLRAQQQHQSE
jgi:hypothetical protein